MTVRQYKAQLVLDGALATTPEEAIIVLIHVFDGELDLDPDGITPADVFDMEEGNWLIPVSIPRHHQIQTGPALQFDTVPFFLPDSPEHEHLATITIEKP